MMTKIALIKTSSRSKIMSGIKPFSIIDNCLVETRSSDDSIEDNGLLRGYIKPDRVIKRIKLNEVREKSSLSKDNNKKPLVVTSSCNSSTRFGLAELYNSHRLSMKNSELGTCGSSFLRGNVFRRLSRNSIASNNISSAW